MNLIIKTLLLLALYLLAFQPNISCQSAIYSKNAIHHPIQAKKGMVASQHAEATKVGLKILEDGGNAIDAAVAVGFALAVVLPRAGNLGGGGFMLVYDEEKKTTEAINYRETAPKNSYRDMYLDQDGNVDKEKFNQSYLSIGVPGTTAGLILALEKHGTMELQDVIAPAINLAKNGFPITHDLAHLLVKYEKRLKKCKSTADVFYPSDSSYYQPGELLIQSDLAWSLSQISEHGKSAFYTGELAEKISTGIQNNGGILSLDDLKNYEPQILKPVTGTYRDHEIVSMPPPSSGGLHLIQMLNILEAYPLKEFENNSAKSIHYMTESMRLAYADRSEHLGDPFYWDVPVEGITSKAYADKIRTLISKDTANLSENIKPGKPQDFESEETTHYSVADQYGNVVSNTYTLNFSFGAGLMAEGTGILLNNEMGDFSAKPGSANAYGLIGGEANAIEAGKRPLSSMTPTIVFKDNKPFLVTGSPGGSRIITTVLQLIINVIDHNMNIAEASHNPRIHHQWYPDEIFYEKGINIDTRNILEEKGHRLTLRPAMGSTQSILIRDEILFGASDPRRPDGCTLGY